MKKCTYCGEIKSLDEFYRNSSNKDGLTYECKDCYRLRKGQKKRILAEEVKYFPEKKRCSKCGKIKSQIEFTFNSSQRDGLAFYCKDCDREKHLKYRFGITQNDYKIVLEQQGGVCAICHQSETIKDCNGEIKALAVDHCHKTGRVRELLCHKCNNILGYANDDINIIELAKQYLKKHKYEHKVKSGEISYSSEIRV